MLRSFLAAAVLAAALPHAASAADPEVQITISDHRFDPAEVKVAANKRVKLVIHNKDATPEEFESHALKVEKVVAAGAKATVFIGPLKPGRYPFVGEFNEKTAKGVVIVE